MAATSGLKSARTRRIIQVLLIVAIVVAVLVGLGLLNHDAGLVGSILDAVLLTTALVLMLREPARTG